MKGREKKEIKKQKSLNRNNQENNCSTYYINTLNKIKIYETTKDEKLKKELVENIKRKFNEFSPRKFNKIDKENIKKMKLKDFKDIASSLKVSIVEMPSYALDDFD